MKIQYTLSRAIGAVLVTLIGSCGDSPQEPAATDSQQVTTHGDNALLTTGGGLTMPVTGTSDDNRVFHGIVSTTGAGLDLEVGPVLFMQIRGALMPGSSASDGEATPTESVPLSFESVQVSYAEMKSDDECIELEINLPAQYDQESKATLEFDAAVLTMVNLPGPSNLLADLICANDRAVELGWSLDSSKEE